MAIRPKPLEEIFIQRKVTNLKPEELLELRSKAANVEEEIRILWSTLEAVHAAMRDEFSAPETYRDAIYGLSQQAFRLKEELRSWMDWLEQLESKSED